MVFLPLSSEAIKEAPDLKKGQQLVVRIANIPEGQKGATLSMVDAVIENERVYKLKNIQPEIKSSKTWQILVVVSALLIGLYFTFKS